MNKRLIGAVAVAGTLFAGSLLPAAAQENTQSASLSNDASFVSWFGNSSYIASQADEKGMVYYKVDETSKKAVQLITGDENANAACAAGDGSVYAYTNDSGKIVLINAYSNERKELAVDTASKSDLNLSQYGGELYYINDVGGKDDVIDVQTRGSVQAKTIVADSKKYKTDLVVNGNYAVYNLSQSGSVTEDKKTDENNATDVNVTVNAKGSEPQLYLVNLNDSSKGGQQITTTADSKVSPAVSKKGDVAYISVDENSNATLMYLPHGGSWKQIAGLDAIQCEFDSKDNLIFSATDKDGVDSLYKINGSIEPVKQMPMAGATEFSVSPDAGKVALFGGSDGISIAEVSGK